jgi:hypothetical protein
VPVVRPSLAETTALAAAYVARLVVGVWNDRTELVRNWSEDHRWEPRTDPAVVGAVPGAGAYKFFLERFLPGGDEAQEIRGSRSRSPVTPDHPMSTRKDR